MQQTTHQGTVHADTGLTDEQLRAADAATRSFYLRVYRLMNESGADVRTAIMAVQDAIEGGTHNG